MASLFTRTNDLESAFQIWKLSSLNVANRALNMADNTAVNYIYLRAYEVVTNTIAGQANPIDTLLIDVLIMMLDYLNRLLVNTDTNSRADGIIGLVQEAVNSLMSEKESRSTHEIQITDGADFVTSVCTHNRG